MEILKTKVNKLKNKRVHGGNFENLNKYFEGTQYTVKNDLQVYDKNGIARGSFSLRFVEDDIVEILSLVPYGCSDELTLACE